MSTSFHLRSLGLALVLAGAAGCSSPKTAIYEHENFDDSGTFSRDYPVSDTAACEAARRALLSQGYIITSSDPKLVAGNKSFQQTGETHLQISFNVVCADDGSGNHHSTMFANALQDRYALKKVNNSASLGVGVLGSVSMPIGSTDDSMVKVASETVSAPKFYERYFALVDVFLPQEVKKAAHIPEKPKADLGIPEPKAAPAADKADKVEAPKEVPKEAPATPAAPVTPAVVPAASEPVVPPAEPAPIAPKEAPAPAPEATTPALPAPTEAIPPLPTPAQ
ncbi:MULTISPECIES: DUF2242 domain-containing protein [Pseudomonas]|jgi:hypothetical protein|uniref:DUF2242 domain-containing protein n=2 Tax=Pseudomonas TaxID=286 RepID=UPI000281CBAB|nr:MULTISPECIES: DUF2242 domain-containing protein [Pseudomonas]AUO24449.1 DUF2242 domain-containing protein [Pseudomonas sp. NC02]NVZ16562.1 DUF2242 domain-containing protein [Pseudomonas sp. IPO3775]NWA34966.1 DUF2242 domain-containing protein [Pseudomonas sp. C6002]NWA79602.1 DUF2242 domain-containing protein [Pseudomonas sp. C8002]NWA90214.1 DUF2242 domain-containing protein [Pseudomonas sp. D8002]